MNDNWQPGTERAFNDAQAALDLLIARNKIAAIPTMIAALIGWSVENGAAPLLRTSLTSALETLDVAEAAWKAQQQ